MKKDIEKHIVLQRKFYPTTTKNINKQYISATLQFSLVVNCFPSNDWFQIAVTKKYHHYLPQIHKEPLHRCF